MPSRSNAYSLYAPGHASTTVDYRCPGRNDPLPAVDAHRVPSESRYEILHGQQLYAAPAHEEHGRAHADLATLLTTHTIPRYTTGVDMLTRVSEDSEIAPDACVYPKARDAQGHRQLERLAFEIADSTTPNRLKDRARLLAERGVHRIFCIDIQEWNVLEWNKASNDWKKLSLDSTIEDECLLRPLSVEALLDSAKQDDEIAKAILLRHNAIIEQALQRKEKEGEAKGMQEGEAHGLREAIYQTCEVFELPISKQQEVQLLALNLEQLRALHASLLRHRTWTF